MHFVDDDETAAVLQFGHRIVEAGEIDRVFEIEDVWCFRLKRPSEGGLATLARTNEQDDRNRLQGGPNGNAFVRSVDKNHGQSVSSIEILR